MSQKEHLHYSIFSAQGADTTSSGISVADFKNIAVTIAGDNSADLTIRVKGSLEKESPTFSSAASPTNLWDYIAMWNLQTAATTPLAGDTGFAFGGTDSVENLLVNVDGLTWIALEVSSYVAGDVTATTTIFDNR